MGNRMSSTILLEKLIEIERSIGVETECKIRRKVLEAQEYLLRTHGLFREGALASGPEEYGQCEVLQRAFSLRKNAF